MTPELIIARHPGRMSQEGRACIGRDVGAVFPGTKVIVLCEGVEMWMLGDDGRVYDLTGSGAPVEGRYSCVLVGEDEIAKVEIKKHEVGNLS